MRTRLERPPQNDMLPAENAEIVEWRATNPGALCVLIASAAKGVTERFGYCIFMRTGAECIAKQTFY